MVDFLQKSEKKRSAQAQDGDLSELFEALEMEDDGKELKGYLQRFYSVFRPFRAIFLGLPWCFSRFSLGFGPRLS